MRDSVQYLIHFLSMYGIWYAKRYILNIIRSPFSSRFEYWFEEPQYLLTIEEKEILAKERAEAERKKKEAPDPTRRILLRIEAQDICRVPDAALKVAMCDVYSGSLKLVLRDTQAGVKIDNWVETESIGSRWVEVKSTGVCIWGWRTKLQPVPTAVQCVVCCG